MSQRKIKHWGKDAGEAFGKTGYKGMKGEHWFAEYYRNKGYDVVLFEKSREHQLVGIDVLITDKFDGWFTVDVKNNLRKDNSFFVEMYDNGWLFNPNYKNEFISHVNIPNRVFATYRRSTMQTFVREEYWDYRDELLLLSKDDVRLNFIKWTFVE